MGPLNFFVSTRHRRKSWESTQNWAKNTRWQLQWGKSLRAIEYFEIQILFTMTFSKNNSHTNFCSKSFQHTVRLIILTCLRQKKKEEKKKDLSKYNWEDHVIFQSPCYYVNNLFLENSLWLSSSLKFQVSNQPFQVVN